jgi:DNA-binding response OmpR family regulator
VSHEPNPTILIVDDEAALADGHASQLDDHDVRTAYDGAEALEALDPDVDIVLLDRRMPGLSGDEVLERIRAEGFDCRVIMLTGVEPSVDIVEMGFDEYLEKPVREGELRETVERVHQRTEYDAKLREYFSLASKRATLETRHSSEELAAEPKYEHLCERLRSVQAQLDDVLSDLPDEDGYLVATQDSDDEESTSARADG